MIALPLLAAACLSAQPPAEPVSYAGLLDGKYAVTLSLRRQGTAITGYCFYGERAATLSLAGSVDARGVVSLTESDGKATHGTWTGLWKEETLVGTWSDGKGRNLPFVLHPLTGDARHWLSLLGAGYAGTVGRLPVAFAITAGSDPSALAGAYRYEARTGKLAWQGKIVSPQGDFELTERDAAGAVTGTWRGKVLPHHLDGVWLDPRKGRALPFALHAVAGNPFAAVSGTPFSIRTVKRTEKPRGCEVDSEYDQIAGLADAAVQRALNEQLRTLGSATSGDCNDGDGEPYTYTSSAKISFVAAHRYLVVTAGDWEYTGGAHGNSSSACHVFDLRDGSEIHLAKDLKPSASARVRRWVVEEVHGGDEEEAATFIDASFSLSDRQICPDGGGLSFQFDPYEVASYADGSQTLEVAGAGWKRYFVENELTRAMFERP